jgi:hypothetical protein
MRLDRSEMPSSLKSLLLFILGASAFTLIVNASIPVEQMPNYATWTGIRPLEAKLDKLDRFVQEGPVDALIVGSSITDYGFNAELYSQIMAEWTGVPYRAFNFATGGAEIVTLPKIYRLARTSGVPRSLIVVMPYGPVRNNSIRKDSPDYILSQAPIGRAIAHPWFLPLDRMLWRIPIVRHATALRDLILHGKFVSLPQQGSDAVYTTEFGDTVAYMANALHEGLPKIRSNIEAFGSRNRASSEEPDSLQSRLRRYFDDNDIDAIEQLRSMSERDGFSIIVIMHAQAVELYQQPVQSPTVRRERREYGRTLAEALNARLVHEIDDFAVPAYGLSDSMHLNIHGSLVFTRQVAQALTGRPSQFAHVEAELRRPHPHIVDSPSGDPTISHYSPLIDGPSTSDRRTLQIEVLISHAIPPLPEAPLFLAVRLPDNTDLIAAARRTGERLFEADFSEAPVGRHQLFYARLVVESGGRMVTFNQPIATYSWIDASKTALAPRAAI